MIDLNTADRQSVQALSRLREPELEAVLRLLSSEANEAQRKLVKAGDMVTIHRLQGRVEAFEDLLRAVEDSPKVLNRA
jgi:histone H3/H4